MSQLSMELQALLIGKAMEDEAFKRELLGNTKAAIAKETGQKWPDGVDIVVLEQTPAKLYLVLPMQVETGDATKTQEPMDLQALLIGKAMADETFRRELLGNPKAILAQEIGQQWSDNVDIVVLEQTPAKLYLVLSPQGVREESPSEELSDDELEAVAGGIDRRVAGTHNGRWCRPQPLEA